MSYFPFFVDLSGKHGLIVGGECVALRKVEKLLPYGPKLTVAAPQICPELMAVPGLRLLFQPFSASLLEQTDFVIAATDDPNLNHHIANCCHDLRIPVNVVDDKDFCSFLFPALIRRGDLSIGISTGGSSPSAAVYLKQKMEEQIPDNFEEILVYLESMREPLKRAIPDQKQRAACFRQLFLTCLEQGGPPAEACTLFPEHSTAESGIPEPSVLAPGILKPSAPAHIMHHHARPGHVYLVGAGCGEADLITVRGLRLLESCDVVIYDELIDHALLSSVPQGAERIPMGKRGNRPSASQAEINQMMIRSAGQGKAVVRLKGGDPFVFGRGGEETLALIDAGIPFEVIPGISSSIAIPALAGIPVTHRGVSQSFHVITAHTADTPDRLPADLELYAALPGTLIILMGLTALPTLADRLIRAGKDPWTAAAVLSGGNSPHPASVRGTLADLAQKAEAAQVKPPAVIVIGDTACLELLSHPSPG